MTVTTDVKKTATDTGYAVVGLTDLAVERVRGARAKAVEVRSELEKVQLEDGLKRLQAKVQQLPTAAVSAGVEAATKAEEAFGELTARGRTLVERLSSQRATQDLLTQGKLTISRGKAAVTTIRRGADDTTSAARATVTTAEREAGETAKAVKTTARKGTQGTKSTAKRTATTARKRTAASKSATKSAVTSAQKTAGAAVKATETAAEKVGD